MHIYLPPQYQYTLHSTDNNPIDHIRYNNKLLIFLHLYHSFLYDISNNVPHMEYNYNFHIYNLMSPSNLIKILMSLLLSLETHWVTFLRY